MRLGVLGSTRGTNLSALATAIHNKYLAASIEIVVSNKEQAFILERAKSYGFKTMYLSSQDQTREEYDAKVSAVLHAHRVELVVLIGYMRILSEKFVTDWQNKILNVHPSLLPAFSGKMDLAVHQAVLDSKVQETGCTIHYVTKEVDAGPILLQKRCAVYQEDNAHSLKQRVQALEGPAFVEAIQMLNSSPTEKVI